MAYALLTENLDDEKTEQFDVQIGMIDDPADEARDALRAHQEAMGMTFDDPDAPVTADPTTDAGIDIEY